MDLDLGELRAQAKIWDLTIQQDRTALGTLISEKRRDMKLSRRAVVEQIEKQSGGTISVQYLCDIEHGRRMPRSAWFLAQLAAVLEIPFEEMFRKAGLRSWDWLDSASQEAP